MRKLFYFLTVGVIFAVMLLAAVRFDRARRTAADNARLEACDKALRDIEGRYLQAAITLDPQGLSTLRDRYEAADGPVARRETFEKIVQSTTRIAAEKDASNNLVRPLLDELAGALNRYKIARNECAQKLGL